MCEVEANIYLLPLPATQVHGVPQACNSSELEILESVVALILIKELGGLLWPVHVYSY